MAIIIKKDFGLGFPTEAYFAVTNVSYNTNYPTGFNPPPGLNTRSAYGLDKKENLTIDFRFYFSQEARRAYLLSGWVSNNLWIRNDPDYKPSANYDIDRIRQILISDGHLVSDIEPEELTRARFDEQYKYSILPPEETVALKVFLVSDTMNTLGEQLLNGAICLYPDDPGIQWPTALTRSGLARWAYEHIKRLAIEKRVGPLVTPRHPEWVNEMVDDTAGSVDILNTALAENPLLMLLKTTIEEKYGDLPSLHVY